MENITRICMEFCRVQGRIERLFEFITTDRDVMELLRELATLFGMFWGKRMVECIITFVCSSVNVGNLLEGIP